MKTVAARSCRDANRNGRSLGCDLGTGGDERDAAATDIAIGQNSLCHGDRFAIPRTMCRGDPNSFVGGDRQRVPQINSRTNLDRSKDAGA